MGTRCDFYQGRGLQATYLGSIARDAYVDVMAERFAGVDSQDLFLERLKSVFAEYGEIPAASGWPWPWRDSSTTDTVVAFDQGQCWTAHPDGVWALLERFDEPTQEPLVFADMRSAEESTPEGRLRRRLRFGCSLAVGPKQDVMQQLLWRCSALLARAFQHGAWRQGTYWVMATHWEQVQFDLGRMASTLRTSGDEFSEMLAQRRRAHDEREWDLLAWLVEHGLALPMQKTSVALRGQPDAPVFFGMPCSAQHLSDNPNSELPFYTATNPDAIRQCQELLELVVQRAPSLVSLLWEDYMVAGCHLPVTRAQAQEWLDQAHDELGGLTLEQAAATKEGRGKLQQFAACLIWDSKEFMSVPAGAGDA